MAKKKKLLVDELALRCYDDARAKEGYAVAQRVVLHNRRNGSAFPTHLQTVYLSEDKSKPALLVQTFANGSTAAWEAVR